MQNDLVPGSNKALLAEVLAEEAAALAKRRDELLAAAARVPVIENEAMAGKIADLARMVGACIKAAEDAHKDRKAPALAEGRAVDAAYKREIIEPLASAKEILVGDLAAYQDENSIEQIRGELGGLSSLREEWDFEILELDAIDYIRLSDYLSRDAVEKAVRSMLKDGVREMNGIRIFKKPDVTIR